MVEAAMTSKPVRQVALSEKENVASYAAHNETLRQENARLKDLVVKLSAIIVKNVADQK
jgi:hypothetical protein